MLTAQPRINPETEQRRQQQHHADQSTPAKLLLPHHCFVGFERQHLIVAAHHNGHAKVGYGQREH